IAALTLILGAAYTLWMYKRVFFGPVANEQVAEFKDLNWIELTNYILLAAGVFWLGLYPDSVIKVIHSTLGHLLLQSMPYGLAANLPTDLSYFA
ncbi:MAG TPA: NADH-quinone oxidoreductase subunit M, partial [Gammaproteobacteria bacterium]|nr:NADH-quinone oxidoreductase subunit M [Gammaproteobacteria bacterium]